MEDNNSENINKPLEDIIGVNILLESYPCFKAALSGRGNFGINQSIRNKVDILKYDYKFKDEEILSKLYSQYAGNQTYLKYDPAKSSLKTFILYYVKNYLRNLIRKAETEKKRLNKFDKSISNIESPDIPVRYSMSDTNSLIIWTTPEDLLIAKELMEIIIRYVGEDDADVLFGNIGLRTQAKLLDLDYDTYRKRIYRKKLALFLILEKDYF
ncbi:MAG: hypothetical protein R6X10_15575 [Desulfobacterales bacterium]